MNAIRSARWNGQTHSGHKPLRDTKWKPTTCQFIDGDAKDRKFCGDPVVQGHSYCARHMKVCVVEITTPFDFSHGVPRWMR